MRSASLISSTSVRVLAESGGVGHVREDVIMLVAPEVELKLREVVQDAIKFRIGARRTNLCVEDVRVALFSRGTDAVYGHGSLVREDRARESLCLDNRVSRDVVDSKRAVKSFSDTAQVKDALPNTFLRIPGVGGLFSAKDRVYGCGELLESASPKVPVEGYISAHWLAIEGIQPRVPENPIPEHCLDPFGVSLREGGPLQQGQIAASLKGRYLGMSSSYYASLRPIVKNILSLELQLYFEKVCLLLRSNRLALRKAAIDSVAGDPGIQPLVPYFCQYVNSIVLQRLDDLQTLEALATLVRALVLNPFLHVEPYLHQIIPPIITLVVGVRIGQGFSMEDHWKLRDFCSRLIALICTRFNNSFRCLRPRLLRTITRVFLDPSRSIPALYGAIRAITHLGTPLISEIVAPHVDRYCGLIQREVDESRLGGKTRVVEIEHLRDALGEAMGCFMRTKTIGSDEYKSLFKKYSAFFGKSFVHHSSVPRCDLRISEDTAKWNIQGNPLMYAFPHDKHLYAQLSDHLV